jgi:hypothetical protein
LTANAGETVCRKVSVSTRLYFILSGHATAYSLDAGHEAAGVGCKMKRAGDFLLDCAFLGDMALQFTDLCKKVMLSTVIRGLFVGLDA